MARLGDEVLVGQSPCTAAAMRDGAGFAELTQLDGLRSPVLMSYSRLQAEQHERLLSGSRTPQWHIRPP